MSTWIKIYNAIRDHPKTMEAGDRAMWLHVCGMCYANEHLTDGLITRSVLPTVSPATRHPEKLVPILVAAGLWEEIEGGWRLHDYTKVQRTAAEVKEQREAAALRKRRSRASHNEVTV